MAEPMELIGNPFTYTCDQFTVFFHGNHVFIGERFSGIIGLVGSGVRFPLPPVPEEATQMEIEMKVTVKQARETLGENLL